MPGDVLFIRGEGGFADIGTTGGFLGHFLVVTATPARLTASELKQVNEMRDDFREERLWKVETVESTRNHCGLHRSHLVLFVEPGTSRVLVVAEILANQADVVEVEPELVHIWQSPAELRLQLSTFAVEDVISDMKVQEQNWSYATAARALLLGASVEGRSADKQLLHELSACWLTAPICTSVVVIFWQRLLGHLAPKLRLPHAELIMRYLPLKADRGLPTELLAVLGSCGWTEKHKASISL